jgi:hypothetical protein
MQHRKDIASLLQRPTVNAAYVNFVVYSAARFPESSALLVVTSPAELVTKNDCADEAQQKLTGLRAV